MSFSIGDSDEALKVLDLISPYFKYDWLMPRAFVVVCPYEKLPFHFHAYRNHMSAFVCWKIGNYVLPTIDLQNTVEVNKYPTNDLILCVHVYDRLTTYYI